MKRIRIRKPSLPSSLFRNAKVGYLYENGFAVILHRERAKHDIEIEYATLIHPDAHNTRCSFSGRIVFHHVEFLIMLLRTAHAVRMHAKSVSEGSHSTKRLDIAVESMSVEGEFGGYHLSSFPDLISAPWSYQPSGVYDAKPVNATLEAWGDAKIVRHVKDETDSGKFSRALTEGKT